MSKILFHCTEDNYTTKEQYSFDKVICIKKDDNFKIIIDYINKKHPDYNVFVSKRLSEHTDNLSKITTIKLPRCNEKPITLPKVVFYAQSDTLAHTTLNIISEIKDHIDFYLFTPIYQNEGATDFFTKNGYTSEIFSKKRLQELSPDYLLLLNDWTKEAKRILSICKSLKIKNICLQESIIDFGSKNRMKYADNVFMQGIQSVLELNRKDYFITGNPRYKRQKSFPASSKAFINSNFTYGIFEEWRDKWIDSITDSLKDSKIDFFISQHPRDNGDLTRYHEKIINSSSSSIKEQISESSFAITRFSSIIHESLLQYRPVIYYNPHGEKLQYDFDFNHRFLFYTQTPAELRNAIEKIKTLNRSDIEEEINNYLQCHCLPKTGNSSTYILDILKNNNLKLKKENLKNKIIHQYLYAPFILKPYFALKKMLKDFHISESK